MAWSGQTVAAVAGPVVERGVRPHCVRSGAARRDWSLPRAAFAKRVTGAVAVQCRSKQALLGAG